MRVWDICAGYLNRQSLLGAHREIHGVVSIIVNKKTGYSKHPETVRWVGYGWALRQRHRQLSAEMSLRGFSDNSPVVTRSNKGNWPELYIDGKRLINRIYSMRLSHVMVIAEEVISWSMNMRAS